MLPKNSKYIVGNRIHDLPACSAVLQTTSLTHVPSAALGYCFFQHEIQQWAKRHTDENTLLNFALKPSAPFDFLS
jgi:hypothetical protein